jgi:hypothetical protein
MAPQALNGAAELQYLPTGIVWEIRAPLSDQIYLHR